jgi:hypothetical protein
MAKIESVETTGSPETLHNRKNRNIIETNQLLWKFCKLITAIESEREK